MKRHAYLIVAHNQFEILMIQLRLLDHKNNNFYIHIDKKAKNVPFSQIKKSVMYSKIFFIERDSVNWGGYSMIQCELKLLKAATREGYDYYHLLSGVDLPIKSKKEIFEFFENSNDKEYLQFSGEKISDKALERIQTYWLFQEKERRHVIFWVLNRISNVIQKVFKIDRTKNSQCEFQYGANWFSITHDLAEYIVEKETWIEKYFKLSCCADELFVQSIVINSTYKYKLVEDAFSGSHDACLRHIDWNRGTPYVFRSEDLNELLNSKCLFARKFDMNVDYDIIRSIDRLLVEKNEQMPV